MKQNKIPRNEYIRKPVGKTNPYKHDVLYTNLGQWKYPGQVTRIPSNDITMQGVPYPVYGEDDLGYGQMMYPGMDYTFPGQYVTEIPMAQDGAQSDVLKTNIENSKKFLIDMANSPLFAERYARMTGNTDSNSASTFKQNILDNINTVKYKTDPEELGKLGASGSYHLKNHIITQSGEDDVITDLHELSHASTKGKLNTIKKYKYNPTGFINTLTEERKKFMDPNDITLSSKIIKNIYDTKQLRKYLSDKSEIKSRVDVARKLLSDAGLYDPVNNTFGEKDYENLKKFSGEENIMDLLHNYSKEEVISMFNDIVSNNKNQNLDIAQEGGDAMMYGGIPMAQKGYNIVPNVEYVKGMGSQYDPILETVYVDSEDPIDPEKILQHEMWHHYQNYNNYLRLPEDFPTRKRPQTPSTDEVFQEYYNRKKDDVEQISRGFRERYPEFKFVPNHVLYDRAINGIQYDQPWTMEGEGRAAESPEGIEFLRDQGYDIDQYREMLEKAKNKKAYGGDPSLPNITGHYKTGGWLDQYAEGGDDSAKKDPAPKTKRNFKIVDDPNDPAYKDFLIRKGLYEHSTIPNIHLRRNSFWRLNTQKPFDMADFKEDYDVDRIKRNKSYTDESYGPHGSKVNQRNYTPEEFNRLLKAQAVSESEYNKELVEKYPPASYQFLETYKHYPYDTYYAANKDRTKYTKPTTRVIEDKIDRKALKEVYPELTDKDINNYLKTVNQSPDFITNVRDANGSREYLYNFEKRYTDADRPPETYTKDGIVGYLPEEVQADITKDKYYLPVYNKPEDEYFLRKSNIDYLEPGKAELQDMNVEDAPFNLNFKKPIDYKKRQWDFNSPMGRTMRYYDAANKLLYSDIMSNGKVQRFYESDYEREKTPMNIPYTEWEKMLQNKKLGGWLDKYQPGGRVMPSETTQSFIPAGLRYKMDQLKRQDPKQKQKLAEEKKYYENIAKAKEDARKQEIADRKARIADSIEAQKESVIGNPNWREVLARQTQATGDKFRVSDEPNFFDDYINPGVWIGDMASGLGQAPYAAKELNSNLPYALAIGAPLLTGALEGIGGKSTKDFLTNIISPVPFTGEMINKGLNKIGKTAKNASKYFNKKVSATPFKSEIDWSKWNPETPKYPELINEYNTIEESTKKAGTWMKNADGTPYKGSPEQFVQEQSSHFKKAYPQGYDETFRGVGATNTNPDFSKGSDLSYTPPELTGDRSIFTADYDLAKIYAFGEKNPQMLNPFSEKGKPGVFNLIHPKGKQIEINTLFDDWQNVDLRKANKAHLQADLNNKKLHLQKMIDNPYANEKIIEKHKKYIDDLQKNIDEFDSRITDAEELSKLRANIPTVPSTDDIAAYLPKSDLRKVTLRNLIDGAPGDVTIVNNRPGNYLKSRIGNVGFFDMTNPNIYKALVPAAIATGVYQQQEEGGEIGEDEFRKGGLYTPPKIKRKAKKYGTSKNIQSSINKLFTRNYDVFGPGGKNIYNPKAYKTGGWLDNVD